MSNIDKQALNQEKIEWLNKLADMEYCKSNPGHWLMSLKDTNMLAKLALRSVALLDELEAKDKQIAELETREVILPQRMDPEGYHIDEAYMVAAEDGEYLDRDEVIEAMRTAGIRINGEG